jgi:glutaredoxin 3
MPKVEIYTTATCPYCMRAKMLLAEKNVNFTEIPVDGDPALRRKMTQRAQGRTTVPQIFIGDRHVGGCDDLYALDYQGALDPLLAG